MILQTDDGFDGRYESHLIMTHKHGSTRQISVARTDRCDNPVAKPRCSGKHSASRTGTSCLIDKPAGFNSGCPSPGYPAEDSYESHLRPWVILALAKFESFQRPASRQGPVQLLYNRNKSLAGQVQSRKEHFVRPRRTKSCTLKEFPTYKTTRDHITKVKYQLNPP